jgi:hypothetical protein
MQIGNGTVAVAHSQVERHAAKKQAPALSISNATPSQPETYRLSDEPPP